MNIKRSNYLVLPIVLLVVVAGALAAVLSPAGTASSPTPAINVKTEQPTRAVIVAPTVSPVPAIETETAVPSPSVPVALGGNWKAHYFSFAIADVVALPDNVVLVATRSGFNPLAPKLHRSTDGGATWRVITDTVVSRVFIVDLVVAPDGAVYAGGYPVYGEYPTYGSAAEGHEPEREKIGGGVLESTDSGETWSPAGLEGQSIEALAMGEEGTVYASDKDSGIIYYSTDGGQTWDLRGSTKGSLPEYLHSLAVVPGTDDQVMLGGTLHNGAFRSTDGGWTWKAVTGLTTDYSQTVLQIIAPSPDRAFLSTYSGVYRSDDQGEAWVFLPNPSAGEANYARGLAWRDGTLYYSTTGVEKGQGRVFCSDDYGETLSADRLAWVQIASPGWRSVQRVVWGNDTLYMAAGQALVMAQVVQIGGIK